MAKYLFVAEKSSLMREVQNCYRNHKQEVVQKVGYIDFVALAGHVCRNGEPDEYEQWHGKPWGQVDYPMIPQEWLIKPIDKPKVKEILKTIKEAAKNYDGMIVGTDSDVEGYGIYYLVEKYLGIAGMKALRFIEHSLAEDDVLRSLLSMTDFHEDVTHKRFVQSYILRSRADWLYGMNGTRKMSVKQDEIMTIGRVKAPTIKLVYDNSMSIENFKPRKYYQVEADYGGFTATLVDESGSAAQFDDKSEVKPYPMNGIVQAVDSQKVSEHAPKLYDLAAAQADAGKMFGYSPSQTLDIIQSLYEKHKVISYPRTQCRYVSKAKAKEFPMMLSHMDVFEELAPFMEKVTDKSIQSVMSDKQVVNETEVQKESHDALLPTSKRPVISELNEEERNVCQMIFKRLLAQFLPKAVDNKTQAEILHGDGIFVTKGKVIIEQGWRVLYSEGKDKALPALEKGGHITAEEISPVEKVTSPPKRLNQTSLLTAMCNIASQVEDNELRKSLAESKGIGTPATRASIIKDIINRKYIEEKKNGLYITELGKKYIHAVEKLEIVSPVFAAILDTEMKKVQRGEADYDDVYNKMLDGLAKMCRQIDGIESAAKTASVNCPKCGGKIKISRFKYECEHGDFSIPRIVCKKEINESVLKKMIHGEKSPVMQFTKKDGKKFEAKLMIDSGELKFSFTDETRCKCPVCGSALKCNAYSYLCPNEDFKVSRTVCGKAIDENLLQKLLNGENSPQYTFKKKDGTSFKAKLKMKGNEIVFDFSSGIKCPKCKEHDITVNKAGAFCTDEQCGLKIFRKMAGREFSDTELKTLLSKKRIDGLNGFQKKAGGEFSASVVLKSDWSLGFEFPAK